MMSVIRRICCDHEWCLVRRIYGDEINMSGGRRSWCRCIKCGKTQLRGPLYRHLKTVEED